MNTPKSLFAFEGKDDNPSIRDTVEWTTILADSSVFTFPVDAIVLSVADVAFVDVVGVM
jgi:hypothetical protein